MKRAWSFVAALATASGCAANEQEPPMGDFIVPSSGKGGKGGAAGASGAVGHAGASGSATSAGGKAGSGGASAGSGSGGASAGSGNGGSKAGSGSGGASGSSGTGGKGGSSGTGGKGGSGGSSGASAGNSGTSGAGGSGPVCTTSSPHTSCTCHVYDDHDYWFCTEGRQFTHAENTCVAASMHLMKVSDAAEDDWIYATGFASLGEYWLGSSDTSTPDTWKWLAGDELFWTGLANGTASGYAHWNTGEPNATGDCAMVQSGGVWDDRTCLDNRGYVCEAP